MYKNNRASSVLKWMLTAATALLLTFCVSIVCSALTVSGTIKRGGAACPQVRIVFESWTFTKYTTMTDTNGVYNMDLPIGVYTVTFNAINAIPQRMESVYIFDEITINADLIFGTIPAYDDFSGSVFDTNKWDYMQPSYTSGTPQYDLTPLSASITDGNLKVSPYPIQSGVISKTSFPSVATFEFILPKRYDGSLGSGQGFALLDWTIGEPISVIDFRDYMGDTEYPRLYAYVRNLETGGESEVWRSAPSGLSGYPYAGRPKFTVLKTDEYFDLFVNDNYLTSITVTTNPDSVYMYLYGTEPLDNTVGTVAYFDNIKAGTAVTTTAKTLAQVRATANNGDIVTISDGVVSASFGDAFWIESADRSTGIKVVSSSKPKAGQKMLLVGQYAKANKEAYITAQNIAPTGMTTPPAVLGITGKTAAEMDKTGAVAQGLYVKVYGKVTNVEVDSFDFATGYYLDDGSGLPGNGTYKGIYIKLDPNWRYPASKLRDKFVTIKGPLTVEVVGGAPIPSVRAIEPMPDDYPAEFIAFNDCAWDPSQETATYTDNSSGQTYTIHFSPNVTKYTLDTANKKDAGFLMDEATGKYTPAYVKLTWNSVAVDNAIGKFYFLDGDAYVFSGARAPADMKVNTKGSIKRTGSGYWVDMTFSGLPTDPNYKYEFVCTARGTSDTGVGNNYPVKYVISDVTECINSAASEIQLSNVETSFNTYYNGAGYAAKWTSIVPKADGTFKVRAIYPGSHLAQGYMLNAFMLKRVKVTP